MFFSFCFCHQTPLKKTVILPHSCSWEIQLKKVQITSFQINLGYQPLWKHELWAVSWHFNILSFYQLLVYCEDPELFRGPRNFTRLDISMEANKQWLNFHFWVLSAALLRPSGWQWSVLMAGHVWLQLHGHQTEGNLLIWAISRWWPSAGVVADTSVTTRLPSRGLFSLHTPAATPTWNQ